LLISYAAVLIFVRKSGSGSITLWSDQQILRFQVWPITSVQCEQHSTFVSETGVCRSQILACYMAACNFLFLLPHLTVLLPVCAKLYLISTLKRILQHFLSVVGSGSVLSRPSFSFSPARCETKKSFLQHFTRFYNKLIIEAS
jgi:hypothetical protein